MVSLNIIFLFLETVCNKDSQEGKWKAGAKKTYRIADGMLLCQQHLDCAVSHSQSGLTNSGQLNVVR